MGVLNRFKKTSPNTAKAEVTKTPKSRAKKTDETQGEGAVTTNTAYRIILRPLVTEKAALLESKNKYSFMVVRSATKSQIRRAVKELYKTDAKKVQVVNMPGKKVRSGRITGRRSDYKKAIVTVVLGSSIQLHDNV